MKKGFLIVLLALAMALVATQVNALNRVGEPSVGLVVPWVIENVEGTAAPDPGFPDVPAGTDTVIGLYSTPEEFIPPPLSVFNTVIWTFFLGAASEHAMDDEIPISGGQFYPFSWYFESNGAFAGRHGYLVFCYQNLDRTTLTANAFQVYATPTDIVAAAVIPIIQLRGGYFDHPEAAAFYGVPRLHSLDGYSCRQQDLCNVEWAAYSRGFNPGGAVPTGRTRGPGSLLGIVHESGAIMGVTFPMPAIHFDNDDEWLNTFGLTSQHTNFAARGERVYRVSNETGLTPLPWGVAAWDIHGGQNINYPEVNTSSGGTAEIQVSPNSAWNSILPGQMVSARYSLADVPQTGGRLESRIVIWRPRIANQAGQTGAVWNTITEESQSVPPPPGDELVIIDPRVDYFPFNSWEEGALVWYWGICQPALPGTPPSDAGLIGSVGGLVFTLVAHDLTPNGILDDISEWQTLFAAHYYKREAAAGPASQDSQFYLIPANIPAPTNSGY